SSARRSGRAAPPRRAPDPAAATRTARGAPVPGARSWEEQLLLPDLRLREEILAEVEEPPATLPELAEEVRLAVGRHHQRQAAPAHHAFGEVRRGRGVPALLLVRAEERGEEALEVRLRQHLRLVLRRQPAGGVVRGQGTHVARAVTPVGELPVDQDRLTAGEEDVALLAVAVDQAAPLGFGEGGEAAQRRAVLLEPGDEVQRRARLPGVEVGARAEQRL